MSETGWQQKEKKNGVSFKYNLRHLLFFILGGQSDWHRVFLFFQHFL